MCIFLNTDEGTYKIEDVDDYEVHAWDSQEMVMKVTEGSCRIVCSIRIP